MGSLNLPQIAENQAAAYVTSNDADAALEKALCEAKLDHDASGGNFTIADTDFRQNWFHELTGSAGAGFDVTIPAVKRPFMMENNSGQTATIKTGGGAAGQLLTGDTRLFYCNGSDVKSLSDDSTIGAVVPVFSGAMVALSSDASIANSSNTAIDWDTETYDTDSYFNAGVNPSRYTIPIGVSRIILTAQIRWDTNTTGGREILFYKNGSSAYAGRGFNHSDAASTLLMTLISPPLDVTAGDYFELVVWQNSGSSRDVKEDVSTWFSIQAVG